LAVTEWGEPATLSVAVACDVAVGPVSATGEPKGAPSTTNCTAPVGVAVDPAEVSETVAVKVTACPETDGFDDEATAVVVSAAVTVCETPFAVLPLKFPSPL
jgi:hypothetical protein